MNIEPHEISFPPLLYGEPANEKAVTHAAKRAVLGCDAGLVSYILGPLQAEAALVFTPEVPLSKALAMLPLCGIGLQNALGALAPPEVAVHLEWGGGIRINGAACGQFQMLASTDDPEAIPDWLIIGWTLPLLMENEDTGIEPDRTALYLEGCADVSPPLLVEAWARHTLNWIARWEDEGNAPLHAEWRGLAHGIGETTQFADHQGIFLGVDEDFGMLLRDDQTTHLIPLVEILKDNNL